MTVLFARQVDFAILFELWEVFLFERDKYFIFYFAVALIISKRDAILAAKQVD